MCKRIFLTILLLIFPVLCYGFTVTDGLKVNGHIYNQTSYRTTEGEFVASENWIQLEAEYELLKEKAEIYGVYRTIYDAMYDMRSDEGYWSRYKNSRQRLSNENKMREIYLDIHLKKADIRIGKQQIVWGETDGLRLMDLINPLDMTRQYVTKSWEDIRRPLTSVKLDYYIIPEKDFFLEAVWIPEIKTDKIFMDPADPSSPWSLESPKLQFAPTPFGPIPIIPHVVDRKPASSPRNSEFGLKLNGVNSGYHWTLNFFRGYNYTPVTKFKGARPLFPPASPFPMPVILANLETVYEKQNVLGITFNKPWGMWVFRGEFANYFHKRFNTSDTSDSDGIVRKNQLQYMLGFDRPTWIKALNDFQTFFISGQFFHFHTSKGHDLISGPYQQVFDRNFYAVSLLINTGYDRNRIVPEILTVYDITNTGWYMKPKITFQYGDHWREEIGGLIFQGDKSEFPFGVMNKKDEIYFMIKYQF